MKFFLFIVSVIISLSVFAQGSYQLAVLKYSGGGDYYANPTAVPNLIQFCNNNLAMNIATDVPYVEVGSPDLFLFPFIHMTGHGNVVFSSSEAENLRIYLRGGGFLHIDDNYGMDEFIRVELKKVFPNSELVELPFDHDVFHQKYDFNGLPKIHEHDGKRSQAFGIIEDGRLLCLYTYETDLSDGWENTEVHNDSKNKRELALKMGANILMFAFMQ